MHDVSYIRKPIPVPDGFKLSDPTTYPYFDVKKVWVTTWALSKGIAMFDDVVISPYTCIIVDKKTHRGFAEVMRWDATRNPYGFRVDTFRGLGNEWHLTYEDAVVRAKAMRDTELAKLETKITKLKTLEFKVFNDT